MKRKMLKKLLCIMMVMVMCLTSISLTAFAEEVGELIPGEEIDDSAVCPVTGGNHVRNNDGNGIKKDPTCSEDGGLWLYWGKCGQLYLDEVIPATGDHTEVVDPKVEATCTTPGLTEGSHCSVCGEVIIGQDKIPPTGKHTAAVDPRVEATCTEDGLTEGSHCSVCGETL